MGIVEAIRQGKPVPVPVIDTHTHMGPCATGGLHQAFEDVEGVIAMMDAAGIDAICTAPMVFCKGYMEQANEYSAQLIERYPGRVYANLAVCPHDGVDAVKRVVDKYGKHKGFVAMKFLTIYHGSPLREEYQYAIAFAQEAGCPLTFHYWGSNMLPDVVKVLEKYPKLKLILAHQGGGTRDGTLKTVEVMKQCDRLCIDTCGSLNNSIDIRELAQLAGEDRLVFGSDIHYMEPRYELGKIAFSGMPERVMKKIYAENYLRLLEGSQMDRIKL